MNIYICILYLSKSNLFLLYLSGPQETHHWPGRQAGRRRCTLQHSLLCQWTRLLWHLYQRGRSQAHYSGGHRAPTVREPRNGASRLGYPWGWRCCCLRLGTLCAVLQRQLRADQYSRPDGTRCWHWTLCKCVVPVGKLVVFAKAFCFCDKMQLKCAKWGQNAANLFILHLFRGQIESYRNAENVIWQPAKCNFLSIPS